jgi:hypothetical protein
MRTSGTTPPLTRRARDLGGVAEIPRCPDPAAVYVISLERACVRRGEVMRSRLLLRICCLAIGCVEPCIAGPIHISYVAADLNDAVPGEDRWAYEYMVSSGSFAVDQGFSIEFDAALFTDIESPPALVNAGWDVVTFQPDVTLASPGLYDAVALVPNAPLTDPFVMTFTWRGGARHSPGAQAFTINQFDSSGLLTVIASGTTMRATRAVPEPAGALLLTLGAAGAALRARRTNARVRGRR